MRDESRNSPFRSADEDDLRARHAPDTPQTRSPSYRLAYTDLDFLKREDLRPTRLQLELMKPELLLEEHGVKATVVIFGSARTPGPERPADDPRRRDIEEAEELGRLVSCREGACPEKLFVVTGGGPGIMEAGNRGAHLAGAESIGFNIVLPHEQAPNRYITPELCFQFHYFALRKMHFLMRARALVCFPGGFGTLDELFETLTLIQTGKIEPIPVLLFRRQWWEKLINFELMVEAGMIAASDLSLFRYVESAGEAWEIIRDYVSRRCTARGEGR